MCCDSLLRNRGPSKANNCPPNLESNIFKRVTLKKKAVGQFLFQKTSQVTAMQEEKCKWFMMGSIKAMQNKLAQIPDLR